MENIMSRTYRSRCLRLDCNCGAPVEPRLTWNNKNGLCESVGEEVRRSRSRGVAVERTCECEWKFDYSKRNYKRDRKHWDKPDKPYKQVSKKAFRAKVRHCMDQQKYEGMPKLRHTDIWDWN